MASPRVAVVTGANKGIGFGIMKALCAKFEGIVYLTARDEGRGKAAQAELNKLGFSAKFHQLDISNQSSIDKFAEYIKSTYGGLDVLVNNAGISNKAGTFGEQAQINATVNYFGTLAVCCAFFPLLRPHARVVHVSSDRGLLDRLNGDEPQASGLKEKFVSDTLTVEQLGNLMKQFIKAAQDGNWKELGWGSSPYAMSKIGMSALTRIQQRGFDADPRADMVVNCCHPGYVATDMTSHKGPLTIDEGAISASYCALIPANISKPKGAFIWKDTKPVDWVNGPYPASD